MKLLIVTQTVDRDDPVLGFFHRWIEALAPRFESVEVICLREGVHALPENVRVHSLGKENGNQSRLVYSTRFLALAWSLRDRYDSVFVHMNQEYILIAGWLWKLLGKRIYMWRNHYAGSWLTDMAAAFCTKVFCTSTHSYTAKYRKTVLMPVGVNIDSFTEKENTERIASSILFLARMAPSKRPEILLEALALLASKRVPFTASLYGDPLPQDAAYYESLQAFVAEHELRQQVTFYPGVPNVLTPEVYRTHAIVVNCSRSGMFDKTIFEGASCGSLVVAASEDFKIQAGEALWFDGTSEDLARTLEEVLVLPKNEAESLQATLAQIVMRNSLSALIDALMEVFSRTNASESGKIARYLLSGMIATVVNLGITAALGTFTRMPYLYSVSVAFIVATFTSFLLQKLITFRGVQKRSAHAQLGLFYGFAVMNLFVNDLIVFALVRGFHMHSVVIAELYASLFVAAYSFFVYRYAIFAHAR